MKMQTQNSKNHGGSLTFKSKRHIQKPEVFFYFVILARFLSYLVYVQRYADRQAALAGVSTPLQLPLLGFDLLLLPLHAPLALPQAVQVLLVLLQLSLQLLSLAAQPLGLQEALLLPLLQHTLLLTLGTHSQQCRVLLCLFLSSYSTITAAIPLLLLAMHG